LLVGDVPLVYSSGGNRGYLGSFFQYHLVDLTAGPDADTLTPLEAVLWADH
jgi:hypothetical protein